MLLELMELVRGITSSSPTFPGFVQSDSFEEAKCGIWQRDKSLIRSDIDITIRESHSKW